MGFLLANGKEDMKISTRYARTKAAIVFGSLLGATACTSPAPDRQDSSSSSSPSPSNSPAVPAEMQNFLRQADAANAKGDNTIVSITARPTVALQDSRLMTMVIRDEGQDQWEAGNYRLVVYCVGNGTIFAHFRLGEVSKIAELPPCSPSITTGGVDINLTANARNSAVLIIPAGEAQAAIAYQIQRF